jgi:aspartate/methionine/tyrosine aminotransferase
VARYLNENISYAANSLSQKAGSYALNHFEALVPNVVAIFKERLEYIEERVAAIPFLSMRKVKGTMYAYINISKTGLSSIQFVEKLLKESQVLMIPGTAFGEHTGSKHVRLAATKPKEQLKEAFDRIERLSFNQ